MKDEEMLERLRSLFIHEIVNIDSETVVLRVPGGWIYSLSDSNGIWRSVFVPH